jgi:hypothetical protein
MVGRGQKTGTSILHKQQKANDNPERTASSLSVVCASADCCFDTAAIVSSMSPTIWMVWVYHDQRSERGTGGRQRSVIWHSGWCNKSRTSPSPSRASAMSMMSLQYLPLSRVLALLIQLLSLQSILLPTFCSLPCPHRPQIHAVTTWISYSIIQATSKASLLFTLANTPSFRKPSPHSQHWT